MRLLILSWYRQLLTARRREKGFTLMELLISIIISSVVVSTLLYAVVELVTIDKREATLDQVQRDMNRALEYISDDLQEAVYVYDGARMQNITNQLGTDSEFPDATGDVPVLAFWRIDPIDQNIPTCTPGAANFQECQLLEIRQAAYTLVVYVQRKNDRNGNWRGQSRIIRYELSKYSDLGTLDVRSGYRDPTNSTDANAAFETWQVATNPGGVVQVPSGSSDVLVDYVQAPDSTLALNRAPLSDTDGPCTAYGLDSLSNPLYSVVPATATTSLNNSFFACVRNPIVGASAANRGNQDVYVFLRGNIGEAASSTGGGTGSGGSSGYGSSSSRGNSSSVPILETQVLIKGIVNKN